MRSLEGRNKTNGSHDHTFHATMIFCADPVCRRCLWLLWLLTAHSPVFPVIRWPRPAPGSPGVWPVNTDITSQSGTIRGHQAQAVIWSHIILPALWSTHGKMRTSRLRGQRPSDEWGCRPLLPGDNAPSSGPHPEPELESRGRGQQEPELRGRSGAGQPIGGQCADNRPIVDNRERPRPASTLAGPRRGCRMLAWPVPHNRGYRGRRP